MLTVHSRASPPGSRRAGPHGVSTDPAPRLVLSRTEAPSSPGKHRRLLSAASTPALGLRASSHCEAPALLPAPLPPNPSRQRTA